MVSRLTAATPVTVDAHPVGTLLSVNVGMPKDVAWQGNTVHTGVFKSPVAGRRRVGRLNVEGDGQGDLGGHGGEQRAVFVYQIGSYRYWERELGRRDFVYGQFGENFTVDGLDDDQVCLGDRYRIGTAVFEVTQPRVTCYRVGIRMNDPHIPALLVSHHRPGFYFRVLEEGYVEAGDPIVKVASGPELANRWVFPLVGSDGGYNGDDPAVPPEGLRLRVKPSVNLAALHLAPQALVIATAMQRYGIYLGDSGVTTAVKLEDTVTEGLGQVWELKPTDLCALPFTPAYWEVVREGYDPTRGE